MCDFVMWCVEETKPFIIVKRMYRTSRTSSVRIGSSVEYKTFTSFVQTHNLPYKTTVTRPHSRDILIHPILKG